MTTQYISSVSQIFNAVYMGIGKPEAQYLDKVELANILFRQMSYRMEIVRQSEQRVLIAKTSEFTLSNDENTKDLTALETDFVIPMWAERQSVNWASHPVWEFIPTVNLAQLQERRALALPACSFRGDSPVQCTVEFSYFGNEVATPCRTTRVWYAPTIPFPSQEQSTVELPDNLINMVTLDTMFRAIPICIQNASKYVTDIPSLAPVIAAWNGMLVSVANEREEFEVYFLKWSKGSRGGHRSRRRGEVMKGTGAGNWLFGYQNPSP